MPWRICRHQTATTATAATTKAATTRTTTKSATATTQAATATTKAKGAATFKLQLRARRVNIVSAFVRNKCGE